MKNAMIEKWGYVWNDFVIGKMYERIAALSILAVDSSQPDR